MTVDKRMVLDDTVPTTGEIRCGLEPPPSSR